MERQQVKSIEADFSFHQTTQQSISGGIQIDCWSLGASSSTLATGNNQGARKASIAALEVSRPYFQWSPTLFEYLTSSKVFTKLTFVNTRAGDGDWQQQMQSVYAFRKVVVSSQQWSSGGDGVPVRVFRCCSPKFRLRFSRRMRVEGRGRAIRSGGILACRGTFRKDGENGVGTFQLGRFSVASAAQVDEIKDHLETIVRQVADAANARSFNQEHAPWDNFSPSFEAFIGDLNVKKSSLADFIAHLQLMCASHPEFYFRITCMNVNVSPKKQIAEVFLNTDFEGMPPGIVRPAVATISFRLVDGRWLCTKWTSLRGLVDGVEPVSI